jgi:hypothetical protein
VGPPLQRSLLNALVLLALCVASINGLVRALGGGDPNLLSPRFLPEKVQALAGLGWHMGGHLWSSPHPDARDALRAAAHEHGIPVQLAIAVARTESAFDPHAISRTGAMGLMQLMPATAASLDVDDPFDSHDNARGGARYLRELIERYEGALPAAIAAYNAGPGRVARRGQRSLPAETRHYVRSVMGSMGSVPIQAGLR